MGRRADGLGNSKNTRKVARSVSKDILDYHEGFSVNQVKIVLRELGLEHKFDEFGKWMYGQTCPLIHRTNDNGKVKLYPGVYEYDLFRWVDSQKTGVAPVWD